MSDKYAHGWAVIDDRGLNIATISSTRKLAICNWLMNTAHVLGIQMVQTDDEIEYLWLRHGVNPGRARVTKVNINAVEEEAIAKL